MEIKQIENDQDRKKYDEIVKESGSIFNTTRWLKLFEDRIKFFGIYENEKIKGGFALYCEKKFGLKICLNPPFTPYVGPVFKVESQNHVHIMSKWKEVSSLMAETVENLSFSIITFSLGYNIIDVQPFIWKKFKVIPEFTYILDLNQEVNGIYKNMSPERRNDITRAIKDGVIARKIDDYGLVKSLVLKTFERQGKKINLTWLEKILFDFATPENCFVFASFKGTKAISAMLCIHNGSYAHYLLGGYDESSKHRGAGVLSMWEGIIYAKSLGLKYFDFEGSMVPEIEKYFRGFGGVLTPYFRVNKAKLPLEIFLKFYKRELF